MAEANAEGGARGLAGKKVLITGAAGTLGGWLAGAFAAAGARLALSDISAERLAELDRQYGASLGGGFAQATDLMRDESIEALVAKTKAVWGAPDILVNNAGIYPTGSLLETSNETWDRIFDVNLRAAFVVTRDIARLMIEREVKGSIVNITSGGAHVLRPGLVPYCVSKAALARLTKGFALELGVKDIRVNAVSPGFMPQPSTPPEALRRHREATPLGRHAEAGDATGAVLYLCSREAAFVTGTMIDTDGGYHLTAAAIDVSANANNAAHEHYAARASAA